MNAPNITRDMELRHLPSMHQLQLAKILDVDESVLSLLMGNIVKNLEDNSSQLRFNSTDIDSLREHSVRHGKSSILVLLDEWSTMGKIRPTMRNLLELLTKCQLYRAADFVADLINEARPVRPRSGPAAKVDISLDQDSIENVVNNLNYPFSSINLTKINRINYEKPAIHTPNMNNFVNESSQNRNNQPTATVTEKQQHQKQAQDSDLIKFSQIPAVVLDSQETRNSNSMAIPMTVNSSDNIPQNDSANFIPALSGLMTSGDKDLESVNIPVFLQSNEIQSEVPAFSGLMTGSGSERQQYSSTIEQTQSMTQSSISSIN